MAEPRGVFSLPMIGSDGWVRVPLSTLGRAARAVVDTGAFPELCVPYADAKRKGLVTGAEPKVYPDGDAQDCMLKRPLPFRLGRRSFRAQSVLAWGRLGTREAEDPITHILGLNFLLRYKTEFDFIRRRVIFHPLSSPPQRRWRDAQAIPFQQVGQHALLIPGTIKETPGWFFWDTGAPDVYLFPSALKVLGRRVRWGRSELSNVHGECRQAGPFPLSLTISGFSGRRPDARGITLKTRQARALDAPGERPQMERGVGRSLFGLMNVDLCGAARLLLDPQSCLLWRV